jgi:hypothetical protein
MAEENQSEEASPLAAPDTSAATWGILTAASRDKADTFLIEQTRLTKLQHRVLHHEELLRLWLLRAQHMSALLKVAFEIAVASIVIAVLGFAIMEIWDALHDTGLAIEAFQVPSDMANRGLNGQVVASKVLDKLSAMQTATITGRPAQSFTNNWGDDIKVEIPDTGVSVGEVNHYLHNTLGHETHITGEIYHDANGIIVTARAGGNGGAQFSGPESDLDSLLQQAAENLYEQTQPYRYAIYVINKPGTLTYEQRWMQARQIWAKLTANPNAEERAWAWSGLGNAARYLDGNNREAAWYFRKALAEVPDLTIAHYQTALNEGTLGHDEAALQAARAFSDKLNSGSPGLTDLVTLRYGPDMDALIAELQGDFAAASLADQRGADAAEFGSRFIEPFREKAYEALAARHDGAGTRGAIHAMPAIPERNLAMKADRQLSVFIVDARLGNWQGVEALEPAVEEAQLKFYSHNDNKTIIATLFRPWLALAKAELGDISGAEAIIAKTPTDCYSCVRIRGTIAALAKRWDAAAYWFAMATAQAPSIPFAFADRGRMLMEKGDYDAAIAAFKDASDRGPHFADPLEMWGEVLVLENQSGLALIKFEEADKYAPRWGRLHLEWGEALLYAGKTGEAKKQFALAASLDLSEADKATLERLTKTHG